jgi:hypothetical protein
MEAFNSAQWPALTAFCQILRKATPEKFGRFSNQTWLRGGSSQINDPGTPQLWCGGASLRC